MGSKRIRGIRFFAYAKDHGPPHIHAFYGGNEVIMEFDDLGNIWVARRSPLAHMRRHDLSYVLEVAQEHLEIVIELWEAARNEERD